MLKKVQKVQKDVWGSREAWRRFKKIKKVSEVSRGLDKFQKGSNRLKNVRAGSRWYKGLVLFIF